MKYALSCYVYYNKQKQQATKILEQGVDMLRVIHQLLHRAGEKEVKNHLGDDDDDEEEEEEENDDEENDDEENDAKESWAAASTASDADPESDPYCIKGRPDGKKYVSFGKWLVEYYDHAKCAECSTVHNMTLTTCSGRAGRLAGWQAGIHIYIFTYLHIYIFTYLHI